MLVEFLLKFLEIIFWILEFIGNVIFYGKKFRGIINLFFYISRGIEVEGRVFFYIKEFWVIERCVLFN